MVRVKRVSGGENVNGGVIKGSNQSGGGGNFGENARRGECINVSES